MFKKTDMTAIRAIAKEFLNYKIEYSYGIEQHPYNIMYKEGTPEFEEWKLNLTKAIDRINDIGTMLFIIKPSWHMLFLKQAKPHLSEKDFVSCFVDSFIEAENPTIGSSLSVDELVEYFREFGPIRLMDKSERKIYRALPNVVTIFRGVGTDDEKHRMSLSWTLQPAVAEVFATRMMQQGKVYTATIEKKHILAYFDRRKEAEVIVDPKYLKDITLYKDLSE